MRLLTAVGTRFSNPGDMVQAVIIAPVRDRDTLLLPAGTRVSGKVNKVERLGLGLRHTSATMDLRFSDLHLLDGTVIPIHAQVASVEEAREVVTESGTILGIHPSASFSTGVSTLFALLCVGEPELRLPVLGFKFLAARSPDAEIAFPPGTEMQLRLTREVELASISEDRSAVPLLTAKEGTHLESELGKLPHQQTSLDRKHSSDLINIAIAGTRQSVERAFAAAGWTGTETHGVMALYHMYHCVVQRVGYSRAPMTELTLNSSPPDISFQKNLDTFARRHHIRLWQDERTGVWLGAATEDVKYEIRAMRFTHGSDHQIDNERAKVVNDLIFTGCVSRGALVRRPDLKLVQEGGHSIVTDGDVAVLELNACDDPHGMPANPQKPRPVRTIRAALAVGEDIARSNPVTVGRALIKAIADTSKSQPKEFLGICNRAISLSRIRGNQSDQVLAVR